jgi:hydroxyacylglutathione hydrolase
LPPLREVGSAELKAMLNNGEIALDVRPADQFIAGHVPGSVNIALSGQFATWAGTVLGLSARPVLVADSVEQITEARTRLARIGMEDLAGQLSGGVAAWKAAGFPVSAMNQMSAADLDETLASSRTQILDVRRESEWEAGHIEGAIWWPLDNFRVAPPEIDQSAPIAVHCKSGYRSMIACSLLQRAGFLNVSNLEGGFDAWQKALLPVVSEKPVEA